MLQNANTKAIACLAALASFAALAEPVPAKACGGFFCGRQPVDQTAERIVFKVDKDSTTMIVQIAYNGPAPDFAWVLPIGTVPDVKSLAVFPQRALTALDANTSPQFIMPSECQQFYPQAAFGGTASGAAGTGGGPSAPPAVTVHYRVEVGPYDVAAIESTDPMALFDWLHTNQFNVNDSMLPYIKVYTQEGMKFIALKLKKGKDTQDIQPFQFTLPGTGPSIPLRMTALAAEPEMGILVFVFADKRYNGANWPEVTIKDAQIVWKAQTYPTETNWSALVARGVDEAGGQGWVTELAGTTSNLTTTLDNSNFATPEDQMAGQMLRALIGTSSYVSRLYTRMSAEEMTSDPIFHQDAAGDVDGQHMLSRIVDGVDLCPNMMPPTSNDPCLFTSCGAGGICRPVMMPSGGVSTDAIAPGCACIQGTTARTTFSPSSVSLQTAMGSAPAALVVCQDLRMSFVNPGDKTSTGETVSDPCTTFDCGTHGECKAMNMTPTCVCDQGYVAVGNFAADGTRMTTCMKPMMEVPPTFYAQRLPELPKALPGGRAVTLPMTNTPVVQPKMQDLGSSGGTLPTMSADKTTNNSDRGVCSVAAPGGTSGAARGAGLIAFAMLLGFALLGRRRLRAQLRER